VTAPYLVYFAGADWDAVPGTDRRLTAALARRVPVLWVDPPMALQRAARIGHRWPGPQLVAEEENIVRLRSVTVPLASKRPVLPVADALRAWAVRWAVRRLDAGVMGVVVATPRARFPNGVPGNRLLYLTDDWPAGANLMRLPRPSVLRILQSNLLRADVVAAVTPELAATVAGLAGERLVEVLPNGCEPVASVPRRAALSGSASVAALVGQLNERLDFDVLDAVVATGLPLLVVGPRTDRDPEAAIRLDALLAAETVTWLGPVPFEDLPKHLAGAAVGLTPYRVTSFNRASFPLKTLEYLANGLPVVSTDLPAVGWLNTDLIEVGANPRHFAEQVLNIVSRPTIGAAADSDRRRRIKFAAGHSWDVRAGRLLDLLLYKGSTSDGETLRTAEPGVLAEKLGS
jgi:teichuronic acid biosynthesis glycosyltransferase TuaH